MPYVKNYSAAALTVDFSEAWRLTIAQKLLSRARKNFYQKKFYRKRRLVNHNLPRFHRDYPRTDWSQRLKTFSITCFRVI